MIWQERVFFGIQLEFIHYMDDFVTIKEGHFNLETGFYFSRTIDDDEEQFNYNIDRSSKGSVTGIRGMTVEQAKTEDYPYTIQCPENLKWSY